MQETPQEEIPQDADLPSVDDLLTRAHTLLDELTQFKHHAANPPYRQRNIPMRDFEGGIRAEIAHLSKLPAAATPRNSNLPSYALIWATAKRARSVTAFRQWFRLHPYLSKRSGAHKLKAAQRALVDIVADDGEEWIKVSSVTKRRLLFDVAKEGWGRFGEDAASPPSSPSSEQPPPPRDGDVQADLPEIPLLLAARALTTAARANRTRGIIPRVRLALPRIRSGSSPEVDRLLAALAALGCELTLAPYTPMPTPEPTLPSALATMPIHPHARLTPTLNIDCTILISLISDISHVRALQALPWFNAMLREQLRFEREEALLPQVLYPVLRGRRLVCTEEAAAQCRAIVETIGNEAERARCGVLLGEQGAEEAREAWRGLSGHAVPGDLGVPIQVVGEGGVLEGAAPRGLVREGLVQGVCGRLSGVNRSVFGFGWRTG